MFGVLCVMYIVAIWLRYIYRRPPSIHSICLIKVFNRHFCHINVSIVDIFIIVAIAVPFCHFLHSFFSFPLRCYQQKGQFLVHVLPFNTSFGCHCLGFFLRYPCRYHCVSNSFHFFFHLDPMEIFCFWEFITKNVPDFFFCVDEKLISTKNMKWHFFNFFFGVEYRWILFRWEKKYLCFRSIIYFMEFETENGWIKNLPPEKH